MKADTTTVNNLTGRVTNAESSITQQASEIASRVKTIDFDQAKQRISTAESSITQLGNRITTEISEVEGKIPTAIGATNYIRDFGFANGYTFYGNKSGWQFERIADSTARSGYHIKATCTQAGGNGFHRVLIDLRGAEWQGRTMTYAVDVKTSKAVRMRLGVEAFNTGNKAFDATTTWRRFISTDTVNYRTYYSFVFYAESITWSVGDVIYLRDPQLEDGTVATAPRIAEEDLKTDISSVKTTITQTASGVEQLSTSLSTTNDKVTTAETKISQLVSDVSSKVSQTDFNAEKTKISNLQTSITQQAGQIALKANQTEVDSVKSRLQTAESSLTVQASEIASRVKTSDFDQAKQRISTAESSITQLGNRITTEISEVEGKIPTAIGATNYIRDFGFANGYTFYGNKSGWQFERIADSTARSGYHIKATCTQAGGNGFHRVLIDLRGAEWQGRTMTYAVDVKTSKAVRMRLGVEAFNTGNKAFDATTTWRRFISTDTVNYRTYYSFVFYAESITWSVGDVIYLRDPQLEDGTVATAPRIAEEDLKTDISSVKTTITQTASGVEQLSTSLSTTNDKVTTAETKISQLVNDVSSKVSQTEFNTEKTKISNLQTSVTQQADQIALKANQTELNNLTGRMSTAESSITQVPNKISLAVEEVTAKIPTSAGNKNYLSVSKVVNRGSNNFSYNESTGIWSMTVPVNTDGFGRGITFNTSGNTVMLNGGETLFIGLTVMTDKTVPIEFDINNRLHVNHVSGNDHDDRTKAIIFPTNKTLAPNVWTRVYLMYTAKPGVPIWDYNTNFGLKNTSENVQLQIKEVIMAKSNIPVDYQKAEADTEQSISSLKTSITQQADQIALKAEKTYVDTVKETVDSTRSRVTLTEQSITSLVSGVKTLPDGRTSVFATKIESLEGAITQRVTTQELNNRGYQTSTDVTNTINNRTDLAKKTDIPTTLGGRNLAQKTSADWSTPYTSFYGTTNNCPSLYKILIDDLAVGDTLKSRIVLKYENIVPASGQTTKIWLQGYGNVTGWNAGVYNSSPARTISGSGEMVFEHEFKITADHLKNSYWNCQFRTDYIASGSLQWKLAKVEKGPLWTAWTPAPEDTESSITGKLAGYVTNQTYTTYTVDRQQTDRQITEQITETVSKVPTGPVNLVINGFDPQTVDPWISGGSGHYLSLTTHDFFYRSQKKLYSLYTVNTTEGFAYTNLFNLKRNTKYTLRIGLFAGSSTKSCDIYFMGKPSGGSFTYNLLRTIDNLSPAQVVYYTITFDSGSFDLGQFRIDNNGSKTQGTGASLYICEVSCIEGEYNNSWTPSFDELITEQKFNETKSTVDAFSRAIGTRDENGFVPNIARLVMTQDAFISEVAKKTDIPKYVGGRNYILDFGFANNSNFNSHTSLWKFERISDSTARSGYHIKATCTQAGTMGFHRVLRDLRAAEWQGRTMTYSIDIKTSKSVLMRLGVEAFNGGYKTFYATPGWTRFISTDTVNFRTFYSFPFYLDSGTWAVGDVIYIRDPQLEDGTVATTPKQAPEDTEDALTVVSTRVEQTANSYSIKFLNGANDITTQLNLTNSGARIKSSLIHLDGNVTVSGTAWMDGAIIKSLSADKITTGTLNANNVTITNLSVNSVSGITATYLQSVIGTAFIDWMKGKIISGQNNAMTIDLMNSNININAEQSAIRRISDGRPTHFYKMLNDVQPNTSRTVIGTNREGTEDAYSGAFTGMHIISSGQRSGYVDGITGANAVDRMISSGDDIGFVHNINNSEGWRMMTYHDTNPVVTLEPYNWSSGRSHDIYASNFFFKKGTARFDSVSLSVILKRISWNFQHLKNGGHVANLQPLSDLGF